MMAADPSFEVHAVDTPSAETTDAVTVVVRAAYAHSDAATGLPRSDGAGASTHEVADDLASGVALWVAVTPTGEVVGTVRAVRSEPTCWHVRRLAVAPTWRGTGVARALLSRLEADAASQGADRVALDAVVERGTPSFYAALGYAATLHFAAPDKPLSEVTMVRRLAQRPSVVPSAVPITGNGVVAHWYQRAAETWCQLPAAEPPAPSDTVLVGIDHWRGSDDEDLAEVYRCYAEDARWRSGDRLGFSGQPSAVSAFRMPRGCVDTMLAWWRAPISARRPHRREDPSI